MEVVIAVQSGTLLRALKALLKREEEFPPAGEDRIGGVVY
jgi:hypothetical protein